MGKRSRSKGRDFQSRVARWLSKLGLGEYVSTQGLETTRGNMGDVRREEDGRPVDDGFLVQVKKGKQPSPWRAMQEAEDAAKDIPGTMPLAVVWRDRGSPQGTGSEPLVLLRPATFAAILSGTETDL